jgi:Sulfotransferase family
MGELTMAVTTADLGECPSADALLAMAAERTGLDDFGDAARKVSLEAYATSLRDECWPNMAPRAREQAVDFIVHHLGTRLKLQADRKRHPEIAAQKIERPFIVVGPPRSGSTLLHTLLSLDPDALAPEHWVCLEPSPPAALGTPSPERLEQAERLMLSLFDLIPDVFVTHPYLIEEGSGALAECGSDILNMCFTSQQLWCFYRGEGYRRYLLEADHTAALGFHREFLQHLQWGNNGTHWALKGSDHMLWLGELCAEYPDARMIWTHRDLSQQLGSLASVQAILAGIMGKPVSDELRAEVGRMAIEMQRAAFEKGMAARDKAGEEQFFDVSYHDVMNDPVGTVRRIYARYDLEMSEAHAAAIRDWIANNPATKHGAHKYSSEQFGLDAQSINRRFAPYVERFGFGFGIRPALTEAM